MKNINFTLLIFTILSFNAFAIVPTIDVAKQTQDKLTITNYIAQVPNYLQKMNTTMNAAEQVKNLKGLEALQGAGSTLCTLCNQSDLSAMQTYMDQINGDLCSQFGTAMSNITGTKSAITSLQDVMRLFATNPQEAGMALQQAAVATSTATQNTLAQIQMLQAQAQQRQLAQEKYTKTLMEASTHVDSGL